MVSFQCPDCLQVFDEPQEVETHDCPGEPPEEVEALQIALDALYSVSENGWSPSEEHDLKRARGATARLKESAQYKQRRAG